MRFIAIVRTVPLPLREGVRGRGAAVSAAACLLLALAGCQQAEPYQRAGEWHPLGANSANLSAMVADPHDLYLGRGALGSEGDMGGAAAVARLRADVVKRLPASSISSVQTHDTGPQAGPGNAPTAAAPVAASAAAAGPAQ